MVTAYKTGLEVYDGTGTKVTGYLKCENCNYDSFRINDHTCLKCDSVIDNCDHCTPDGRFCIQCKAGFRPNGSGCLA